MGRKPIKTDVRMKQFTHWLDPEVMAQVTKLVGTMKISEFVRAAIAEKLERDGNGPPSSPSRPKP